MVQYCVMIKGPCQGKSCDFWARVKIRKASVEDLVEGIRKSLVDCSNESSVALDEVLREYWNQFGVCDLKRLCEEDPKLCAKISQVHEQIQNTLT